MRDGASSKMSATSHSPSAASGAGYQLLGDLPRGHPLRRQPLGPMGAECRNMHSKEWRDVARWRIASCAFDDLGESWTVTSEFRVRAA
jgi:hypothetical protein